MTPAPMMFRWDGDAMVPLHPRAADRVYVVGEEYRLAIEEERSAKAHAHYFAALNEAWQNLPEDKAERWPTVEHFRKWLLVKCGYRDERTYVAETKAAAQRIANFVKPLDEFAVVLLDGNCVAVFTAQSQSKRAMGKERFQKSKQDVLDLAADMISVSPDALSKARAA